MNKVLERLDTTIQERIKGSSNNSHTAKLVKKGPEKCAEKFGEESVEAIIEAVKGNDKELISEAADVLFHYLVMLKSRDIKFADILTELENRTNKSGLREKEERS